MSNFNKASGCQYLPAGGVRGLLAAAGNKALINLKPPEQGKVERVYLFKQCRLTVTVLFP